MSSYMCHSFNCYLGLCLDIDSLFVFAINCLKKLVSKMNYYVSPWVWSHCICCTYQDAVNVKSYTLQSDTIDYWWCCIKLEDTAARDRFIYKLHRGLISLQLPVNYACLLCLAACWSNSSNVESSTDSSILCVSAVVNMLESNVAKRRQFLSTLPPSSLTSNCHFVCWPLILIIINLFCIA